MKINVRANEQRIVIERLAVDLQCFRQSVDLLIRRMFCGVSYRVDSKNSRSCSKWAMPPGCAKSFAIPDSSLIMVSAEGRETRARSPLLICTRPLRFNAASASRTEGRPTLKKAISSRSDGNCSPSPNSRRRIICSSSSSTISDSFYAPAGGCVSYGQW